MAVYLGKNKVDMIGGQPVVTSGIDTSDATATTKDIVNGKTAYVNGQKITGNIQEYKGIILDDSVLEGFYDDCFCLESNISEDTLLRAGAWVDIKYDNINLGNATPADVAAGKTFTSTSGLKITGTATLGGGSSLPDGAIAIQIVTGAETSTQIGSGYSLSLTYGDAVVINDSIALAFDGTTNTLSNISNTTDFSVLQGKYVRSGSSYGTTTGTFYYIPTGSTFTVGGQSMSKTLTCDKAQKVSLQKVEV